MHTAPHTKDDGTFVPIRTPLDAILARLAKNFTPEQVAAAYAAAAKANEMPTSDRRSAGATRTAARCA